MSPKADRRSIDPETFIRDSLRLAPAPGFPEIQLYAAHPGSRLSRLESSGVAPYWAYVWSGGAALARHIIRHPALVRGQRVLDFGCGGGIVGIAAALSGASEVHAMDIDPFARAAARLNAGENDVALHTLTPDDAWPALDIVLAGDVFYDSPSAARNLPILDDCLARGIAVLVGDPGRPDLPLERLTLLETYDGPEFGHGASGTPSSVYAYHPLPTA